MRSLLILLSNNLGSNSKQKKCGQMTIPEVVHPCVYEKNCQKTENVDFGHEGIIWAIFGLGKSFRALQNTFKNIFPIEKI